MAQSSDDLDFTLDRRSELPLGTQLAWRLRSLIASGRLDEGDRLPGVREMAQRAGVNVNTVRSAYARLDDEGVIRSEHGRGTFVADPVAARAGLDRLAATFGGADAPAASDGERGHAFASEARRRAALRTEIALLERELAVLEAAGNGETAPAPQRRRPPTPQLLTAADLEAVRDELVERLAPLRADRTAVRAERSRQRLEPAEPAPARRHRAIGVDSPRFVAGAGGWTLRWPA
jgi:DNA-binding transcriptional regulator YhcF (GntR family)